MVVGFVTESHPESHFSKVSSRRRDLTLGVFSSVSSQSTISAVSTSTKYCRVFWNGVLLECTVSHLLASKFILPVPKNSINQQQPNILTFKKKMRQQ